MACARSSRWRRRCYRRRACSFSTNRSRASTPSPLARSRICCTRSSRAAGPSSLRRTSSRSSSASPPTSGSSPRGGSSRRGASRTSAPGRTDKARSRNCSSSWWAVSARRWISTGCSGAADMRRIFGAFLWMRWRVLVNSLERTGSRDMVERFSIATGKLGPIMAMVLLIPSSIGLFVLGIPAGFGTATGSLLLPMEALRYLTFLGLALTLLGPIVLPTRDGGSVARLLLLPIPRTALYLAQVAGALADPWIALMVPTLMGVAIGMAVGRSAAGAILALAAGAVFLSFVLGMASLASSVIHLLLRDRRRGDIVMLLLVLVLPVLAIAPQFFFNEPRRYSPRPTRAERQGRAPSRPERSALRLLPYSPPEP